MADWFTQHFGWMYWTWQSALFFLGIAASIGVMTVLDVWRPAVARQGWLPLATTRGDRLFLSIMAGIGLHLIWSALFGLGVIWAASALSVGIAVLIFWRG